MFTQVREVGLLDAAEGVRCGRDVADDDGLDADAELAVLVVPRLIRRHHA